MSIEKLKAKHPRAHNAWSNMMGRCRNPNHPSYHWAGGDGIQVACRWHSFIGFLKDMGDPPEGLMLVREDNSRDYEPGNCFWGTMWVNRDKVRRHKAIKMKAAMEMAIAYITEEKGSRDVVLAALRQSLNTYPGE